VSARAGALLRRDPETPVLVKADTTVPYGTVVRAMVLLQHAGATKVGFLTDPLPPAPHAGTSQVGSSQPGAAQSVAPQPGAAKPGATDSSGARDER
jgi:hypothetical protein